MSLLCQLVFLAISLAPVLGVLSPYEGFNPNNTFLKNAKDQISRCELHKAIDSIPFAWKGTLLKSGGHAPLYMPISQRTTRHHFYHAITGDVRPYSQATDLNFCLYMYPFWEAKNPHAISVAYDKFGSELKCGPGVEDSGYLSCVWESGVGAKIFVTRTDDETYIVFIGCWEDGITTWFVLSKYPTLEPGLKWEILRHIRSLGFQPADRRETDYETHCPRKGRTFEDLVNDISFTARQKRKFQL